MGGQIVPIQRRVAGRNVIFWRKSKLKLDLERSRSRMVDIRREMKALDDQVKTLEESLEVRKAVERAKGILMDELGWGENQSFIWIRTYSMNERTGMVDVARRIIDGSLRPGPAA